MILGVDVDNYQPDVDLTWSVLKAGAVEFAIVKATQGSYSMNKELRAQVAGAQSQGMVTGLYHWADPMVKDLAQADYFMQAASGLQFDFVAIDAEQQWADWGEWWNKRITKFVAPERISQNAQAVAQLIRERTGKRVVIYTRTTFVEEYARPMLHWLPEWSLWLAQYPSSKKVKLTWDDLRARHMPSGNKPVLPAGCTQWAFWQFTGDSMVLPGCKTHALDVDLFNGNKEDLLAWVKGNDVVIPPQPPVEGMQYSVVVATLNVRSGPSTGAGVLRTLHQGDVVQVQGVGGSDVWAQIGPGEWAAVEQNGKHYMEVRNAA